MKNIIKLLCLLLLITGCSKNNNEDVINDVSSDETIVEETNEKIEESNEIEDLDETLKEDIDTSKKIEDTKVIGEEGKGYVEVPSDWVKFTDASGSGAFQYSSPNMSHIITIEKVIWPEDTSIEDQTLENAANTYWFVLEDMGLTDMEGAIIKFDNVDSDVYEIFGFYDDKKSVWIVDLLADNNNIVYFVSLEGVFNEEIFNYYDLITQTFSFEK